MAATPDGFKCDVFYAKNARKISDHLAVFLIRNSQGSPHFFIKLNSSLFTPVLGSFLQRRCEYIPIRSIASSMTRKLCKKLPKTAYKLNNLLSIKNKGIAEVINVCII